MALLERSRELAAVETVLGRGGVLVVEGGAGVGKTSLIEAACRRAGDRGWEVLQARGSELEVGFAGGVVRRLFERYVTAATAGEREELLAGPAEAARSLFFPRLLDEPSQDTSFAVLHGLYWLVVNMTASRPLLIAVDDVHWADRLSLRWLAYVAPRVEGLALALLVATRRSQPGSDDTSLLALRADAVTVRPSLLSEGAVAAIVRSTVGSAASDELCRDVKRVTGGNPFYLRELLLDSTVPFLRPSESVTQHVAVRIRRLDPQALALAQALAVLGDGCELRHAADIAGVEMDTASRLAAGLVRLDVLAHDEPPRFLHPIVRDAAEASLGSYERDSAHRRAARLLHAAGAPAGQVAAHLVGLRAAADPWIVDRLRDAARAAIDGGAPQAAAELLGRALSEPPAPRQRVALLREAARAEASAGRAKAFAWLEEALATETTPRARAEIALQVAEAYAALFRWVDAVDALERALRELAGADLALQARLEGELVVAGLHDSRRASRVLPVLEHLSSRQLEGAPAEAFAVARGIAALLSGRRADEVALPLEAALARSGPGTENWDTRAALLWVLIIAERFVAVEAALEPMLAEVHRTGSARGMIATYSSLGLLKLRLGALPEADAAARVGLQVLQAGDFAPGLPFAATVLADVAVEAGELDHAEEQIALLPQEGWPAGVGTVLIPSARGRLRLAQRRPADALADFEACGTLFSASVWGMEMRDNGYVHARSGAAQALLLLGERERAAALAQSELADARAFGAPRALGIALRALGLIEGGSNGTELLRESVAVLRESPALLERARSLVELGAALRRAGQRVAAREELAEALDLAARCGARPISTRAREELRATGARPRREWRAGVEALTPSELRVSRLAAEGHTNQEIAHALYVTLKTVEGHLARAYGKLDIDGRSELTAVLATEKTRVPTL